jgi:ribosomal-protein-alanine N-acetyltransferase
MNRPLLYTIRPMGTGDVPAVAAIERLSFPTPWPASSFSYELNHRPESLYYVLLKPATGEDAPVGRRCCRWLRGVMGLSRESRVIGYVGLRLQPAEAHISTIAVHPDWRRKALGGLLLLTAMEKALELEVNVVSLEVRPSNQAAQHLYRKYGFRFMGVHRGYYRDGEDAWLMEVEVNHDAYRARLVELRQMLTAQISFQRVRRADIGQNDEDTI